MRFDTITRKSGFWAILLSIIIVVIAIVRASLAPYSLEVAESPFSVRVITKIIAGTLFVISGIITGRLFIRIGLSKSYCTLPIPIYCLLACGVALSPNLLTSAIVAVIFALAMLMLTVAIERGDDINRLFIGSLLLGALPLVSPNCIALGAIVIIAAILFTPPPKQFIAMVAGWLLPLCAASYIMWYLGEDILSLFRNLWQSISHNHAELQRVPYGAIAILTTILATLVWGFTLLIYKRNETLMLARIRRQLRLFFAVAVIAILMLFLPNYTLMPLSIIALPLSILLGFILSATPTNSSTIAYWLLLVITFIHLFIE